MRISSVFIMILSSAVALFSQSPAARPLVGTGQAVVVTTPDWNSVNGTLQRYQRINNRWQPVGEPIPVVIGRTGMAWGLGLNGLPQDANAPTKKEGDGRSPAGVFPIGAAFGFASDKPEWLKLPYIPLTTATECVDDHTSAYYNSIVDRVPGGTAGWNSSEKMRQIDGYRWGLLVNQNASRQPGAGSCIFLHIWQGANVPTAGCTAMEQAQLEDLLHWFDPVQKPVLITLPEPEYRRLRSQWELP